MFGLSVKDQATDKRRTEETTRSSNEKGLAFETSYAVQWIEHGGGWRRRDELRLVERYNGTER